MTLDLSQVRLSSEVAALLPLRPSFAPLDELRRFGTWWVAPFARVGLDLLGVRLVPGERLLEGPVVWASGSATVTLASSARCAVPVVVMTQLLAAPHRWVSARELLPREWAELVTAHRALGGLDELEALRAVVADEVLRVACAAPGAARDAAAALVFARVDPAPATEAFRGAALAHARRAAEGAAGLAGEEPRSVETQARSAAEAAGRFDPWAAARAALAFGERPRSPERAWRLFAAPAGLDLAWADVAAPMPTPEPAQAARRLQQAARVLAERAATAPGEWIADPLWPAVLALAAAPSPFAYHGIEMLEAVGELVEREQPERALAAVTHVQFWSSFTDAEPMDGAIEAANALALLQRWPALLAMTEAVLGVADRGSPAPDSAPQ